MEIPDTRQHKNQTIVVEYNLAIEYSATIYWQRRSEFDTWLLHLIILSG
eukprot:COSAG05_NODE_24592_length_244_cov_8.834483_1_plen_48_part_10